MSFRGVNINRINGGLGGGGESAGRVAVMVTGCGAIGDTLEVNRAYELLQASDADALGITEQHDGSAHRSDRYQISEVFRLAPDTRIYLIAVPETVKASDLKNLTAFVTALRSIEGLNTVALTGMAAETGARDGIIGMQVLVDSLAGDHIYIDSVLFPGDAGYIPAADAAIAGYPDLRALQCPNVSVVIAHDPSGADGHAAVGSALGMLMVRSVHENLGSVDIEVKPGSRKGEESYSLSDVKTGRWMSAALTNGRGFDSLFLADQKKLDELGYIYVGAFAGYAGYYFSNSHTCDASGSDYCYIERNAVWNKAARMIRGTLIHRIRSKVESDPATGFIKRTTITDWDGRVRKKLEGMVSDGDIAAFDIFINSKQAAVSDKPFKIGVKLVADGIVHEFDVDMGFTNKI